MTNDPSSDARRKLVQTRWVHVDGDDAAHGAIYRDASGDIPLSRRPKEYLEFSDDGIVRKLATGPDDRAEEVDRAKWREEGGRIVFRLPKSATDYQVVEHTPDRLIIHRQ